MINLETLADYTIENTFEIEVFYTNSERKSMLFSRYYHEFAFYVALACLIEIQKNDINNMDIVKTDIFKSNIKQRLTKDKPFSEYQTKMLSLDINCFYDYIIKDRINATNNIDHFDIYQYDIAGRKYLMEIVE